MRGYPPWVFGGFVFFVVVFVVVGWLFESGVFLLGALPVVFAGFGFLLGFVVVAPAAECPEVVWVVVSACGEVVFVVDVEGVACWVFPAAVLACVVVAPECFLAVCAGDVFWVRF